ncbi:MAG: DNA integrity scanning protein DisA nucleotide-binding domain protein [Phycisphaerae bacterium]|nr:DNA integrity scanning protein DisA nucleotide-binding domain protein [Phycisphaerae bacterium]
MVDKAKKTKKDDKTVGQLMIDAAFKVATDGKLQAMMLFVDSLDDIEQLGELDYKGKFNIILVTRSEELSEKLQEYTSKVVLLSPVKMTRSGQMKMAVMISFSKNYLKAADRFIVLNGLADGSLDTLMVVEVGREYEMFQTVDQGPLTEHIRRAVFERVLNLALELAAQGREGKPIGAIFVVGDTANVSHNIRQMIMNPFKGHPVDKCNILDDSMKETVKEFSTIDGAFIIKGKGTIVSAGTYLLPRLVEEELPQGLGARHAAAAAITAATKSVAITISESTGTVRIWRQGKLITEIEKAKH